MTVLVADPDPLARASIVTALTGDRRIEVVGEVQTVPAAVESAVTVHPDVSLISEWFPGPLSGIDAAREIHLKAPATNILMLLLPTHEHDLVDGVKAGVQGYLIKDADMRRLPTELRRVVAEGVSPLSPKLSEDLLAEVRDLAVSGPSELTSRERQVLNLVRRGLSNRDVAASLSIGVSTVKTHVHNLLRKLGCTRRVQLVMLDLPESAERG